MYSTKPKMQYGDHHAGQNGAQSRYALILEVYKYIGKYTKNGLTSALGL